LQNGVDSVERLTPILGADSVIGGITQISAFLSAPGVITHKSQFAKIVCGRTDGRHDAPLAAFAAAAKKDGVDVALSDSIDVERWKKFIFLVALSGMTGATRLPSGPIFADPETRAMFRRVAEEVVAVGRAKGVAIPDSAVDQAMGFGDAAGQPGFKASLLNDLERGGRLELDWLAGQVVALGRTLKVPTPMNEAIYAMLKLYRNGSPTSAR
jgi:2-dehydropantoate 2-reductase